MNDTISHILSLALRRTFRPLMALFMAIVSCASVCAQSQTVTVDDVYLDSLARSLRFDTDDMVRLAKLDSISRISESLDTVFKYAQLELDLAERLGDVKHKALALGYLSWVAYNRSDFAGASKYAFSAIVNADTLGDLSLSAGNYYCLGRSYSRMQNSAKANEFYAKAIELYQQIGDYDNVSSVYRSIGWGYGIHGMYEDAIECYNKATEIDVREGNEYGLASDHYRLGVAYSEMYEANPSDSLLSKARIELSTAYDLSSKVDDSNTLQRVLRQIASVNLRERELLPAGSSRRDVLLKGCAEKLREAYATDAAHDYRLERAGIDKVWARYLITDKQYAAAEHFLDSLSVVFHSSTGYYKEQFLDLYTLYASLFKCVGNPSKALSYTELALQRSRDHQRLDYNLAAATQMMAQAEFDMKMNEREVRSKSEEAVYETRSRMQVTIIVAVVFVLILVLVITFIVVRNNVKVRNINAMLDLKNQELIDQQQAILQQNDDLALQKSIIHRQKLDLVRQNEQITKSNEELVESVNYASAIQRAVMPDVNLMNSIFGDHLVVFKPLAVVSGDFYWATMNDDFKLLAVGDCSGHGVPGAFLSMLAMSILSGLTSQYKGQGVHAGHLLDDINEAFQSALRSRNLSHDESPCIIDMSVVIIERKTNVLHFAGAVRPLVVVHEGQSSRLVSDKISIGSRESNGFHYNEQVKQLSEGDALYLYTDGLLNLFGLSSSSTDVRRYSLERLLKLLGGCYRQPFSIQYTKFELDIQSFRSSALVADGQPIEQTDDAILIGVRV